MKRSTFYRTFAAVAVIGIVLSALLPAFSK